MVSFIKPYRQDPFVGHLATPITTSAFTRAYLKVLPAYRPGLTPLSRGAEIGFTHGYFLVGPFYTFGPLRSAEFALPSLAAGLLASITLLLILTIGLSIYGQVSYEVPDNPLVIKVVSQVISSEKTLEFPKIKRVSDLDSLQGWQKFSEGFFSGGLIGSIVASLGIALYSTYF